MFLQQPTAPLNFSDMPQPEPQGKPAVESQQQVLPRPSRPCLQEQIAAPQATDHQMLGEENVLSNQVLQQSFCGKNVLFFKHYFKS